MESDEEPKDTTEGYSGEEEPVGIMADEDNYEEETARGTLSSPLEEVPSENDVATEQIDEEEAKDDADKTDPPLSTQASKSPSLSPEPSPPPSPSKSSPEPSPPRSSPEPSPPRSPPISPEHQSPLDLERPLSPQSPPHSPSPAHESCADEVPSEVQQAHSDEPSATLEHPSLAETRQELDQSNTVEAEDQQHDTTPPSSPPPPLPSSTPSQPTTVDKKVPVKGKTTTPVKGKTTTPVKGKTTTPVKGKTTTPVKGKTVPVKYKTPVKSNVSATPEGTSNSSSGKKRSSGKKAFQPTQVKPFNFSTDRRVEQRQKYDERKNKMQKAQEERERLESKRREKEEAEAMKDYRKSLIIKARPIQYYTPITVAPSSKPPTLPEGPVLTTMCRSRAADQKSPNTTPNNHPTEYL